jgi:tetratricopeptide (TPR) repeat protein
MKTIIHGIAFALLVTFTCCEKFTNVEPKGKNTLSKVSDLDQLLNHQFSHDHQAFECSEAFILINDLFPQATNVPDEINRRQKSLLSVLLTWDEQSKREDLTVSDEKFERFYEIIGRVANPVLLKVDDAEGDERMAKQLKAEAYVLRAYFHYLAVNFYAKAYNPATAATDGGVPYVKETDLLSEPNKKYTVQEVYDFILADLEAALALNSLPDEPINRMRVGEAFAYAAKAKVLMSMRRFEDALEAANTSLSIKSSIDDHRLQEGNIAPMDRNGLVRPELQSSEDLFYVASFYLLYMSPTPELKASFESGSIFYSFVSNSMYTMLGYGSMFHGIDCDIMVMPNAFYNTSGLTTVDMHLTKAECLIRDGKFTQAVDILNNIRENRVISSMYAPVTVANATEAFALLKRVSRTENWFGSKNYINLKRWNTEDAYKETFRKTLLGVNYELKPDSPLWIFPFPQNATGFNPNLTHNY